MAECPFVKEASHMCSVLIREVNKARTWRDMLDAVDTILTVRRWEKNMVEEWEHHNGDNQGCGNSVGQPPPPHP